MRESERGSWKYEWRYESAATVATTTVVSNAAVSTAMDGDAAVSTNGGNGNAATDDVRSTIHALLPLTTTAEAD